MVRRETLMMGSFLALLLALAACSSDSNGDGPRGEAEAWLTTGDAQARLSAQPALPFRDGTPAQGLRIILDPDAQFQTMYGFGAALTHASAHVIHHAPSRDDIIRQLFSPVDGIGISYVRLAMGASDFVARDPYTYADVPAGESDPDLTSFSIQPDREAIIPVLQDAVALNPSIRLMGSPWSAPAWMKTSGVLQGGRLLTQFYPSYAEYFVRFIEEYAAEGLSIDAVTVQNEPEHETSSYPTMRMEPAAQAAFVGSHLGPALEERAPETRLLIWDHNWDMPAYPMTVLGDPTARAFVDGVAWHCYGGNVDAQGPVHAAHPDKEAYFTECSGGTWDENFASVLTWNMQNLFIGSVRQHASVVLLWNLALDPQHGPHRGGCDTCRGVVTVATNGTVTREPEYYVIGHFSRFVLPGARRIGSNSFPGELENVAFRNADGSFVLVVMNPTAEPRGFDVVAGGGHFTYSNLPPRSVVTLRWDG